MKTLYLLGLLSCFIFCVRADTPANCTYEDVRGIWTFYEGERSGDRTIDCTSSKGPTVNTLKFELLFPNVAVDEYGNEGQWTMVYNQGFEVTINYRKFFAYSKYKTDGNVTTSYCDSTIIGWSHDILSKNWACYSGQKQEAIAPKVHREPKLLFGDSFQQDKKFVRAINSIQNSWRATVYTEIEGKPISHIIKRSGGLKSRIHRIPTLLAEVSQEEKKLIRQLPEEFDWRNVNGVNFVSPVRNQGGCGSCYSFSAMGMLESRLRVQTNNTLQVTFSPQDIVSCSEYSQGCEGGFPYLIAGKYGQDFGVVPEECNPYSGQDSKCVEKKCKRYYVADYKYIGGFYGACNEDLMKLELVQNGPISVSFEVYPDFQQYKGGIYHYTGLQSNAYRFDPFLITNHAVLAVGYGVEKKTGEKYWIVKNSWGEQWGEKGYFRIRRGTDEVNIESIAVAATIIP